MKQEEKQLLLQDICSRLPYGLKLRYVEDLVVTKESHVITLNNIYLEHILNGDADIKPYLRPMSSMTVEERLIYEQRLHDVGRSIDVIDADDVVPHIDWLLAHHFDFRGLIPMGLALEAPGDMYKTE